jgi:leader peptidase (prepilin peptidase)/N-methyltransferase
MPYAIIVTFGLIFGSFLNVCIVRLPRKQSVLTPRSHCPTCHHPIRWYDNIPLLSYLLLGGHCRDCGARISPRYPVVEALTATVLAADFRCYGLSPEFIKFTLFAALLIVLIFTDLVERSIPYPVTIFGIGLGLVLSCFIAVDNRPLEWLLRRMGWFVQGSISSVLGAVSGALMGGGLFYIVGEVFFYLGGKQKEYLGFGDVMLMLMVGTFLGIPLTLLTILVGSLAGMIVALILRAASSRFSGYAWPYGTFLGIAALYASLDGTRLLDAYLRWTGLGS